MRNRSACIFVLIIGAFFPAAAARADDVTINGADVTASAIQATISNNGGGKIIFASDHDLDMDQNLIDVTDVQVNSGVAADIDFGANAFGLVFKNTGNHAIDLQGGGASLTITGSNTTAGLALSGTGQTLTLNGDIDGGDPATTLFVGNNTLQITATAVIDGTVSINGGGATLDIDADATIDTLKDNSGTLAIDIADDTTLTVTTPGLAGTTTAAGADLTDSILELDSGSTVNDLTVTGQLRIQVDANTVFTNLTLTGGNFLGLDILSGVAAVVANPSLAGSIVVIGDDATSIFSVAGAGTVATVLINDIAKISVDASATFTQLLVAATAKLFYDQNVASSTITTLSVSAGGDVTVELVDGATATVTNAAAITGDSVLELVASGAGADDELVFTNGLTLAGTATLRFTNDTGRVGGAVVIGTDDLTIDVNGDGEIETLTPSNDVTIDIADGKQLGVDNGITVASSKTLTVRGETGAASETLTVSSIILNTATLKLTGDTSNPLNITAPVGVTALSALEVDASAAMTLFSLAAACTITFSGKQVLTTTVNVANQPLAFEGGGVVTRLDMTTGTVFDLGGVTVNDLRALPSGGVATYQVAANMVSTVTVDNALTTGGDTFKKTGDGKLIVAGGLKKVLDNATGVVIDIDAGELQVAATAGDADDVIDLIFDDDDDLVSVDGATLKTFGDIEGAAGANTNLAIADDATIVLGATAARTLTQHNDNDLDFLGTVNINGSGGSYTMTDAHEYRFGNVNISNGRSLRNLQPNARLLFAPSAVVNLIGNATFMLDGQSASTPIVLDTTSETGSFMIDRNSSSNLTVKHIDITRGMYDSATSETAECDGVAMTGLIENSGSNNWHGSCPQANEQQDDADDDDVDAQVEDDEEELEDEDDVDQETFFGICAPSVASVSGLMLVFLLSTKLFLLPALMRRSSRN